MRVVGEHGPVTDARTARVWSAIREQARREGAQVAHRHVCLACAEDLSAGVALSMTAGRGGLAQTVAATDQASAELEECQSTLGEGPGVDVANGQAALFVPELTAEYSLRWPMFTDRAAALGVRAVFAFPISAGTAGLGVLDVYRDRAGPLTDDELADALAYADAALALTLDNFAERLPKGSVDELFTARRAAIHQASGMVSVQLGVSVADALARLRAHAFATDRQLADVAADVVARRLRFDADD